MSPAGRASTEQVKGNIRDAYARLPKGPAGYVGLADVRDQLRGMSREDQDEALRALSRMPGVHLTPVANRKSLTQRDRDASVRIGEDDAAMIAIDSPPPSADLDAKRRRVAELAAQEDPRVQPDLRLLGYARQERRDLERQIARAERGDDEGKVDQPREVTRAQVLETTKRLIQEKFGSGLVPITFLRGNLTHIKHDELTAVLKEMDRERIIHLDPDSNQKALPPEAREAAVSLGGEDKHFISLRRG